MPLPTLRHFLFLVALFAALPAAPAQEAGGGPDSTTLARPKITAIILEGNRRTRPHIILREMKSKVGQPLDRALLEGDQKRIFNLGIFSRVEIQGVPEPEGVQLLVMVDERWYLYPYPILFLNDRDWNKLSYGAGLLYFNFRGRNETIAGSGWGGFNPALQLDYSNPWLFGNAHVFGRWRFYGARMQNRYFHQQQREVDEKRVGGSFSLGKRFGYFTYVSLQLGYSQLRFDPAVPGETLHPSGRDVLPTIGLTGLYDARDLYEYPMAGNYVRLWARRNGLGDEYVHYWRYGLDLRHYQKLAPSLSLALRGMADLGHDRIPVYDLVYLGFQERVRGHFYRRWEGNHLALGSAELRIPFLPARYYHAHQVPVFGEWMDRWLGSLGRNWKFGLSAGVFVDYGLVWSREGFPDWKSGRTGVGAGLHIHMPLLNLLRLEVAFNEDGVREGIADLGVAF